MSFSKLSGTDMNQAYEIFQGLFFASSWHGEDDLERGIFTWARAEFPGQYQEWADEGAEALEASIRDEEGASELAGFVNSLAPNARRTAIEGMYEDLRDLGDPHAFEVLNVLGELLESI